MSNMYTKQQYREYVENKSPKSKKGINMIKAFVVGGLICVVGELVSDFFRSRGVAEIQVTNIVPITMIFIGAFLTALNVYDAIGNFAGAGSAVPITGFANSIVSPAMEFKSEGYVMGVGSKMFVIAGPVLVYGITASVVVGIIYFIIKESVIF